MELLVVGIALFFASHLLPVFSGARASLRNRLGEGGYKGLFSLVSAAGLVLIVIGYGAAREAGSPLIWDPPSALRHLMMLLMLPVFIFLAAAYNPGRIKAKLKHPMLVAVKLWAFSHLLVNGDVASILLFGSFLAWAVIDRISLKRRPASGDGSMPDMSHANRNDAISVIAGLGVYIVFAFWFHEILIGVPVV